MKLLPPFSYVALCILSLLTAPYSAAVVIRFDETTPSATRSLKSFSSSQPDDSASELVAFINGTIYLQDSVSGEVLWSFSSGSPIYSSYQSPLLDHQHSAADNLFFGLTSSFFLDYGDDWQLYLHAKHSTTTRMKLREAIDDFINITPHICEDGAVILGSKKTTAFVLQANTGRFVRTFSSPDSLPPYHHKENESRDYNNGDLIYITRTDYVLETFGPNSDKVSWSLEMATIEAAFLCKDATAVEADLGMASRCQSRRLIVRKPDKPQSSLWPIDGNHRLLLPSWTNDSNSESNSQGNKLSGLLASPRDGDGMLGVSNDLGEILLRQLRMFHILALSKVLKALFLVSFAVTIALAFVFCYPTLLGTENFTLRKTKGSERLGKNTGDPTSICTYDGHLNVNDYGIGNMRLNLNQLSVHGVNGRRIGKLYVSDTEIAKGSNGTVVLEGIYEGRLVAVKRLVKAHNDVAFKEIQNLIASDRHPNIVRWYGVENDKDFIYLSLERCTCSLDDLIRMHSWSSCFPVEQQARGTAMHNPQLESVMTIMRDLNLWKLNGQPSTLLLTLMRDVASGLAHLHELGIIHRDLKPQNVLISKERYLCAKLSDMGMSKRLLEDMSSLGHQATGCGSSGWQAPEQLLQGRQTRSLDLFGLGCILFFCITSGGHPFGEPLERDINIVNNRLDLSLLEHFPEAENLISILVNPDPELRPKAQEVLHHPMFWSSETRLSFLRDTSDRVELEDRDRNSDILKALEGIGPMVLGGGKWDGKIERVFISNVGHYRRYKYDSVRDLLRLIRNKLSHYRELPKEIQELIGPVPDGYDEYFTSRFPKLLIEVYKVALRYCGEEECFRKYFNP
ncbi:Serine/threonine-protein kinase/endoribonuclease IRE1a [Linum perenne]